MTQKRVSNCSVPPLVAIGLQRYRDLSEEWMGRRVGTTTVGVGASDETVRRAIIAVLRAAAQSLVSPNERAYLRRFRLFDDAFCAGSAVPELLPFEVSVTDEAELGLLLEALIANERHRKQSGAFYTPRVVVDDIARRAVDPFTDREQPLPRIVDPACGGGAFLFGIARELERCRVAQTSDARRAIFDGLYGFDIEPLAVAVSELSLAVWAGAHRDTTLPSVARFRHGDSLAEPVVESFDLVIGNPPWVAYAGRATQPLSPERRRWLAQAYAAFHGYPTLHACFVELGAKLAPRGRVVLLLPSPVADLDGYRPMRQVLTRTHRVSDELVEYGQDAFDGVVQPCFALIADADAGSEPSELPFRLLERTCQGIHAERVEPPAVLIRLRDASPFSPDTFREFGFQTNSVVTKTMLLRNAAPNPPFTLPLLEGRDVREFRVGAPRLFLNPDRELLRDARCKLRAVDDYRGVDFVVRQTAMYPIAALHSGLSFRNSLIAGFASEPFSAQVIVGLLNSILLRALHLAKVRDARQKTFPQVKVSHLRSLPAPPLHEEKAKMLGRWVQQTSGQPLTTEQRTQLDRMVFDWYNVSADEAATVARFYLERSGKSS
jgi:SAM-dependent methyltransferase